MEVYFGQYEVHTKGGNNLVKLGHNPVPSAIKQKRRPGRLFFVLCGFIGQRAADNK